MSKQIFISLFALLLVGCSATPEIKPGMIAWDGVARDPALPRQRKSNIRTRSVTINPNSEREKVLAGMRPYSAAWWVVQMKSKPTKTIKSRQSS
jgi:hypothetical protein